MSIRTRPPRSSAPAPKPPHARQRPSSTRATRGPTQPDVFEADLALTGSRQAVRRPERAVSGFNSSRMRQFVVELETLARTLSVQIEDVPPKLGRWNGALEPSLQVHAVDGRPKVLELAARMGKAYDQDAVLVMSTGSGASVYKAALPPFVPASTVEELLSAHGISASTMSLDRGELTLISTDSRQRERIEAFLQALGEATGSCLSVTRRERHVQLLRREEYDRFIPGASRG